jgi:ketosteroid isomerase-like protein
MTAEQNIETARQMYQAFGSGDVQAILDLVADDVDWSTAAARREHGSPAPNTRR